MKFRGTGLGLLAISAAAIVLIALLLVARTSFSVPVENKAPASPPAGPRPQKVSKDSSNRSDDLALGREIDRAIDESELTQARWGVSVMSLNDGRVVYSRDAGKLFTPASNMKVYTTAVALDLLGTEYRWRTSVYAAKDPDNDGVIDGDLILYGRGAPDFVSSGKDGLAALADQLYQRGVRRVRGDIVGDESYLRGEPYGDGWQWTDLQWYFGAAPSALTIDANAIELTVTPGARRGSAASLEIKRQTDYVHLRNNMTTGERGSLSTIGINRGLSDNNVVVWGEFPEGGRGFTAYLSIHNPALWAADKLKESLTSHGIRVDGETRSRDFRVAANEMFDPSQAVELAHIESKPLGEIVRATNKESINLNAELILRTLGKERGLLSPEPDPRRMKERGDDQAGIAVIKMWLERAGITTTGVAIRDGSGLSRLNLVSPESTVHLLLAVARTNSYQVFRDSLPVAGRDGTLAGRLRGAIGRVVAKTGTLTYDHSLSGYATTQNSEVYAFSIFCNDAAGRSDPVKVIDRIAGALASVPGQGKP